MSPVHDPDTHIRIRMYDVGFGDCFLILIPYAGGYRSVLVDCGSTGKGRGRLKGARSRLFDDLEDELGELRLDVVIATHRHQDHVACFDDPVWSDVKVREVWLPWTENPDDPEATALRDGQTMLAQALVKTLGLSGASPSSLAYALALNAMPNQAAMDTLLSGFSDASSPKRRFLSRSYPKKGWFRPTALPGTTVHVLGPSRDQETIKKLEPPHAEHYLGSASASDDGAMPARPSGVTAADWRRLGRKPVPPHIRRCAEQASRSLLDSLAVTLENVLNGTSLVLALEIADRVILLPGDAEWGTWEAILGSSKQRALLAKTAFYKVGHHGSFNATPRRFVEEVIPADQEQRLAMASVLPQSQWPRIPKPELMTALGDRGFDVARSDEATSAPAVFTRGPDGAWLQAWIPLQ